MTDKKEPRPMTDAEFELFKWGFSRIRLPKSGALMDSLIKELPAPHFEVIRPNKKAE